MDPIEQALSGLTWKVQDGRIEIETSSDAESVRICEYLVQQIGYQGQQVHHHGGTPIFGASLCTRCHDLPVMPITFVGW
jgi:hypothetical protein